MGVHVLPNGLLLFFELEGLADRLPILHQANLEGRWDSVFLVTLGENCT